MFGLKIREGRLGSCHRVKKIIKSNTLRILTALKLNQIFRGLIISPTLFIFAKKNIQLCEKFHINCTTLAHCNNLFNKNKEMTPPPPNKNLLQYSHLLTVYPQSEPHPS